MLMEPSRKVSANPRSQHISGEELSDLSDFSSLGLISLSVFSFCGFTVRSPLTRPMSMLIPATCAFSVATLPNTVVFGTNRTSSQFLSRLTLIVAGCPWIPIFYGMGNSRPEPESFTLSSMPVLLSSREWSVFRVNQRKPHHPHEI